MKKMSLVSLISTAALSAAAFGAPKDLAQLQIFPKNLARQHLGANLFHYAANTQSYTPTEAAAAWLDDDITTGWPLLAGKQYYLLALPEPELITNFCLSARAATGTITLYAGEEPASPGAKSWTPLAKDVPFDSVNEKKLTHPFSREAKYVLIETDVADPGPIYSLYLYGEKPAVSYDIQKRDQPIDTRAIFGPYVNEQTSFNIAGLYAKSYVAHAESEGSFASLQKAIDDNPETALTVTPSSEKSGVVIRYEDVQSVSRIALLTEAGAKGKLEFYLLKRDVASAASATDGNDYIKASTAAEPAAAPAPTTPVAATTPAPVAPAPVAESSTLMAPTVSIVLDGTNPRTSVDFPATQANEMLVRWTPVNATDSVSIKELNAFGTPTLSAYNAAMKPEAVAAFGGTSRDRSKDGSKDLADNKKEILTPVASGPQPGPYLPGALGFPPNILVRNPGPPPTPNVPPGGPPPQPPGPPPPVSP